MLAQFGPAHFSSVSFTQTGLTHAGPQKCDSGIKLYSCSVHAHLHQLHLCGKMRTNLIEVVKQGRNKKCVRVCVCVCVCVCVRVCVCIILHLHWKYALHTFQTSHSLVDIIVINRSWSHHIRLWFVFGVCDLTNWFDGLNIFCRCSLCLILFLCFCSN